MMTKQQCPLSYPLSSLSPSTLCAKFQGLLLNSDVLPCSPARQPLFLEILFKSDIDEGDTDDEELPTPRTRSPQKIFPRSLDLLFGGVVPRAVGKPRPAQFTREVLMMELLAAEESDEEPDDGALPGSEDEYTP